MRFKRILLLTVTAGFRHADGVWFDGGIPDPVHPWLGASDVMPKTVLSKTSPGVAAGGVCLDGSPPAYYLGKSTTGSTTWVLQFQGGAWAYTPADAKSRSTGALGSSTKAHATYTYPDGPLSSDPTTNPLFHDANRVLLLYCDGGSFAGHLDAPLVVSGSSLFVRGRLVMDALLAALVDDAGMDSATEVLVTGTSAGGLGTILAADHIADVIRATVPALERVGVAPLSGFFLDHADRSGSLAWGDQMRGVFDYQNCSGGVPPACLAAKLASGADPSACFFANESVAVATAPLFLSNSVVDQWQLENIWAENDACVTNDAQFGSCSDAQVAALNGYGADFMRDFTAAFSAGSVNGNGAFIEQCNEHVGANVAGWTKYVGGGERQVDAVGSWWSSLGPSSGAHPTADHTRLPDCALRSPADQAGAVQCNPTCFLDATVTDDAWWNSPAPTPRATHRPTAKPSREPAPAPTAFCDACASDAFPVSLNDTQCFNLAKQPGALDSASCRASCCADRACNVWQFCPGDDPADTCNGPSCWTGTGVDLSTCSVTSNLHKGWVSEGADAPICA